MVINNSTEESNGGGLVDLSVNLIRLLSCASGCAEAFPRSVTDGNPSGAI